MLTVKVDISAAAAFFAQVEGRSRDLTPVWNSWVARQTALTDRTFEELGSGGGSYRGIVWDPPADQYTRKDGTVIPAWGGVPRVRAGWSTRSAITRKTERGIVVYGSRLNFNVSQRLSDRRFIGGRSTGGELMVRGRLRPSGRRWGPDSKLMQDTGKLRAGATQNYRIYPRKAVIYVPSRIGYAAKQQEMRPFLFVTPEDADWLATEVLRFLVEGPGAGVSQMMAGASGSMMARIRELDLV